MTKLIRLSLCPKKVINIKNVKTHDTNRNQQTD